MGESRARNLLRPPPQDGKTFRTPAFKEWKRFGHPPLKYGYKFGGLTFNDQIRLRKRNSCVQVVQVIRPYFLAPTLKTFDKFFG